MQALSDHRQNLIHKHSKSPCFPNNEAPEKHGLSVFFPSTRRFICDSTCGVTSNSVRVQALQSVLIRRGKPNVDKNKGTSRSGPWQQRENNRWGSAQVRSRQSESLRRRADTVDSDSCIRPLGTGWQTRWGRGPRAVLVRGREGDFRSVLQVMNFVRGGHRLFEDTSNVAWAFSPRIVVPGAIRVG
jgi:hypothetical protein